MSMLGGQIRYQLRLLQRTPRALFSAIVLPVLLLVALWMTSTGATADTYDYLVCGAAVFGVISIGYVAHATGLVTAREAGVLRRFRGTPLPPSIYLAGRLIATVVMALAASIVAFAVAFDLVGIRFPIARVPLILLAVLAGAITWAALGTAVSGLLPNPGLGSTVLSVTYLPVLFISGVFFPSTDEPVWVYTLASWLPAAPFSRALQWALRGDAAATGDGVLRDFGVLALWTVVGVVGSMMFFRWSPSGSKGNRTATRTAGVSAAVAR